MKNKIQEIENENFILKFIKDQVSKGIGSFAICQFKNTKKISFKFDFDFMLSNFQNCELSFDLNNNKIQCYTPKNTINTTVLTKEAISYIEGKDDVSPRAVLLIEQELDGCRITGDGLSYLEYYRWNVLFR